MTPEPLASYSSVGVQVGPGWRVNTLTTRGRPPILLLDAGTTHLVVHPAGDVVSVDHLEFAHALVVAVGEYLIECDRLVLEAADRETGEGTEPLAA